MSVILVPTADRPECVFALDAASPSGIGSGPYGTISSGRLHERSASQGRSRTSRSCRGRARAFLLAALLDTGHPVLVLPQRRIRSVARRVVIAWNQSAEAAAATSAAIPAAAASEADR